MDADQHFRYPQVSREHLRLANSVFGLNRHFQVPFGEQIISIRLLDGHLHDRPNASGLLLRASVSNYQVMLLLTDPKKLQAFASLAGDSVLEALSAELLLVLSEVAFEPIVNHVQSRLGTTFSIDSATWGDSLPTNSESQFFSFEIHSESEFLTWVHVQVPSELTDNSEDFLSALPISDGVRTERIPCSTAVVAGFVNLPLAEWQTVESGDLVLLDAFSTDGSNADLIAGGCLIGEAAMADQDCILANLRPAPFARVQLDSPIGGSGREQVPHVLIQAVIATGFLTIGSLMQLQNGAILPLNQLTNHRIAIWTDGTPWGTGELVALPRGAAIRIDQPGRIAA